MTTMIWDGEEFHHVAPAEAKALAKADKAQILDGTVDGLSLKYRHEFTGYDDPEPAPEPAPEPTPAPQAQKSEETDPMAKAVKAASLKPWTTYKKLVSDALDKPFHKTTKADVEEFLAKADDDVLS